MAKKEVEKFAIVRSEAEIPVVRKMGVPQSHIAGFEQREKLVGDMHTGDVLCVGSVRMVATGVADLGQFLEICYAKGILFQSACEKALSFSQTTALSPAVRTILHTIARNETEFIGMIKNSTLKDRDKLILMSRIRQEYMNFVCMMFNNNNGIIKQRNL